MIIPHPLEKSLTTRVSVSMIHVQPLHRTRPSKINAVRSENLGSLLRSHRVFSPLCSSNTRKRTAASNGSFGLYKECVCSCCQLHRAKCAFITSFFLLNGDFTYYVCIHHDLPMHAQARVDEGVARCAVASPDTCFESAVEWGTKKEPQGDHDAFE